MFLVEKYTRCNQLIHFTILILRRCSYSEIHLDRLFDSYDRFFIYFEPFRIEPYDPNVEVNGKTIPTVQGSYCWSSMFSAQCADMVYVDALHMTEKSKPVIVSPSDKIHLSFDRKPDTLHVVRWDSKTKSEQVSLKTTFLSHRLLKAHIPMRSLPDGTNMVTVYPPFDSGPIKPTSLKQEMNNNA